MKANTKIFQSLIITWLEAQLITKGGVTTNQAADLFGIKRQNMAAHVKKWQEQSALPVYDRSLKCFVSSGKESNLFKSPEIAEYYLLTINHSIKIASQD